jgi:ADP-ribosylglycohydrolase
MISIIPKMYNPVFRAMLGALVGDAAGATLEFMDDADITPEVVRRAMTMPGGGAHNVGPGQITDDGELTLAAWQHISPHLHGFGIPRTNLVRAYAEWIRSRPFDVGWTCKTAFRMASRAVLDPTSNEALIPEAMEAFEKGVRECNIESEANGALMRSTALATWASLLTTKMPGVDEDIAETDALLSHPSIVCQEVNKIYVKALYHLLQGTTPSKVLSILKDYVASDRITSEKVRRWFDTESLDIEALDCTDCSGHVRYAFVMAMYFLRHPEVSYEDAIYQVLLKGGDSDTNACIVGGLVACYQPIPEYMLRPVLTFDCTKEGRIRPEYYSAKRILAEDFASL